jgi:hypothetical protein
MRRVLTDPLLELRRRLHDAKSVADGALAQVPDSLWFRQLDPESNSIGTLVRHLAGSMASRWTDFLATDGEKPDRRRDLEFEDPPVQDVAAVADLRARWESAWSLLFREIDALSSSDLERTVTIRGEPHTVFQAALRQLGHAWYHVGQIVSLAKHFAGPSWRTLSVPKGGSEAHTAAMLERFKGRPCP